MKSIEKMKAVNIRTVDPSVLKNIDEITVDQSLSKLERWAQFIEQVKNPFCYICNGVIVKISYSDNAESFENKLVELIMALNEV